MEIRGAVIIQARTGSSRMPGKVLLPFYGEKSILDIIVSSLQKSVHGLPVCIATSVNESDNAIADFALRRGVHCYRGDEQDVLARFVGAAKQMKAAWVVRVCADNPFLDVSLMDAVIKDMIDHEPDYCSFLVAPEVPAIKSHWGIFTEAVAVSALQSASAMTNDPFYHEHVTNYIYGHEDFYICRWIKAANEIYGRTDVRFTIDTPADFALMQRIWSILVERDITPNFRQALDLLKEFPEFTTVMKEQISINSK